MTTDELKKEADEYFKNICEDYNEEYERTGKRHYFVGFDIKNAYIDSAKPREKRIETLEKRCANYEMTISKMEKGTCDICKETEKDKKIEELEKACDETQELLDRQIEATYRLDKENAELKKQVEQKQHLADVRLEQSLENYKLFSDERKARIDVDIALEDMTDNLTKAKEIIKNLLSAYTTYADSFDDRDNGIVEKAEQFLNSEPQSKWINPARTTNDNEIKIK